MKILFTGASSFTGFWFARGLAAAGNEVVCPVTRAVESYTGTRRQRIELLKPFCRLIPETPFGSDHFLRLADGENFDQLCHHAAAVGNYKSQDFDPQAALRNNTNNLADVLQRLLKRGLRSVTLTGTYFEAGEGDGSQPLRTFSPYSLSKTLTFDAFREQCGLAGLSLGKFVIPNPFGPYEEPRFTAFLMNHWAAGKPAEVKTPDYVRDNIHADLLAAAYVKFSARMAGTTEPLLKTNPSGYAEKQGDFAQRLAREVRSRTGWACEVTLAKQEDFREPVVRVNTEPAANVVGDWSEPGAWDNFTQYYTQTAPSP